MDEHVASPAPPAARRPRIVERSCLLCHQRKIRCDKRSPCSSCVRTGVLCCYPSAEQPARKPRKTTISDVAERLGRLERTLVAISSAESPLPQGTAVSESARARSASPELDQAANIDESASEVASVSGELLLQNGDSNGYYINEVMFSRILEEEQEIQSALGVRVEDGPDTPAHLEPFNLIGILSGPPGPLPSDPVDLQPPKPQAMQLWQIFVNNVEPFSKTLHVPTAQIGVFKAIENPRDAPGDANCLLFAIYFAAMTSITPAEATNLLGWDKMSALRTFKRGLELSLAQPNFLDEPTLISLQAMCIFFKTVRAHNTGRSVWILAGLVTRAAQSIGIHRDGKHLSLPPFEAEIRRRLWLNIIDLDMRAAEDHGIDVTSVKTSSDVALPLNVDDSHLYPGMTELPKSQTRWTEMSIHLVLHELGLARCRLNSMLPPSGSTVPSEAARREVIDTVKARVERDYLRHHNPVIPVQRFSTFMAHIIICKLDLVSRLQWLTVASRSGNLEATEELLASACHILEYCVRSRDDELFRSYRWIVEIYPQYHTMLYILWHLCVRPESPGAERAWAAVDALFEHEFMTNVFGGGSGGGSGRSNMAGFKWAVLRMLREKAMRLGTSGERRRSAAKGGDGEHIQQAADEMGWSAQPAEDPAVRALVNDMNWAMDDSEPPDWHALVDDLGIEGCDFTAFLRD